MNIYRHLVELHSTKQSSEGICYFLNALHHAISLVELKNKGNKLFLLYNLHLEIIQVVSLHCLTQVFLFNFTKEKRLGCP